MNILFITWDGPQVFYLESLYLPIFRRLSMGGLKFFVLQFTWSNSDRLAQIKASCAESNILYRSVRIRRTPPALGALLTAARGVRHVRQCVNDWDIDVLMPRSTLPMFVSLLVVRSVKLPLVFDADGLPLDERVEFDGLSPTGSVYRFLRAVEAQGIRQSQLVLTRSAKASEILRARAGAGVEANRFQETNNGRDEKEFMPHCHAKRAEVRAQLGISLQAPLVVYAGSLGEKYQLRSMLAFFSILLEKRPDSVFLILTGSPQLVATELADFPEVSQRVIATTVSPSAVCSYLAAADLGLAIIAATFSMQAVSVIKTGEYLLCGLPVFATRGVGDTTFLTSKVAFLIDNAEVNSLQKACSWFVEEVLPNREKFRASCRKTGKKYYSIRASVRAYQDALESVHLSR